MNRRTFLATAATLAMLPAAARATVVKAYSPGLVDAELAAGRTVFVDFTTDWCTTCRAQRRQITKLLEENPAYGQAISFVTVDFDEFGRGPLARRLGVTSRSVLVVLRGNEELGRVVSGTSRAQIKGLMDIALQAATA